MTNSFFNLQIADSPLVGAAIHAGHAVRDELKPLFNLDETQRLREEDPYTDLWADVAPNTIKGLRSRFEADLNRPRNKAIYLKPEDAWGLQVWNEKLPDEVVQRSLREYDLFYESVRKTLQKIIDRHGYVIVLDIHTYNYKREGVNGPEADPNENPEVNIGTSNMDRERWAPVVDNFMEDLRRYDYNGRHLDVRENVKFKGGHFSNWIHSEFQDSCSIAIEFKKFFMNEWTGELDRGQHQIILNALEATKENLIKNSQNILRHV